MQAPTTIMIFFFTSCSSLFMAMSWPHKEQFLRRNMLIFSIDLFTGNHAKNGDVPEIVPAL
jgi:hypothetical protein